VLRVAAIIVILNFIVGKGASISNPNECLTSGLIGVEFDQSCQLVIIEIFGGLLRVSLALNGSVIDTALIHLSHVDLFFNAVGRY
jgi:hypothetical protein